MLTSLRPSPAKRWPRGQRFLLSPRGVEVEAAYRVAIQEVRALGRDALEVAQSRWATPLGLEGHDGVVLSELRPGRRSLPELTHALEVCGTTPGQVRDAVDRLVERGMVEPVPSVREAA
ncbi:MAG TPA: hypothetical protein VMT17_17540 [Anaeromyxobacteraceae bacterium]|nr:hypothetical protein [Anaeromyxobacteraceae bacterium]